MTWAEFRIRAYALARIRKREEQLVRLIAWEVHTVKYMFSDKHKPPTLEKYWPIEKPHINQELQEKRKQAMIKAVQEYQRAKAAEKDGRA